MEEAVGVELSAEKKRVLFIDWDSYGKEDLVECLGVLGYEVVRIKPIMGDYLHDPDFAKALRNALEEHRPDYVFTSNFYPVVSGVLRRKNIPYISWIYDSPLITLFSNAVNNPCNFIFIFDFELYKKLYDRGIRTVYYMPMAVNAGRIGRTDKTGRKYETGKTGGRVSLGRDFKSSISFVGSLYDNKNNLFDRMVKAGLDEKTKGYLMGIMQAQSRVYGKNFLEELITPEILKEMERTMDYAIPHGVEIDKAYVYANYFLGHKTTVMERRRLLKSLSERFETAIYTTCDTKDMPGLINKGPVDYYSEMPEVFKNSRINLNITLRSIHTGMPLRAVDIMGWGGFLVTNYQEDFERHFVAGEDFVPFYSEEDLLEKCEYFLGHEKERREIAQNGERKVLSGLTMEKCLEEMFKISGSEEGEYDGLCDCP